MGDLSLTGQVDNAADEPMAHQTIQFGSFIFDMKKNNMKEGVLSNTGTWGTNLIFKGSNLLQEGKNDVPISAPIHGSSHSEISRSARKNVVTNSSIAISDTSCEDSVITANVTNDVSAMASSVSETMLKDENKCFTVNRESKQVEKIVDLVGALNDSSTETLNTRFKKVDQLLDGDDKNTPKPRTALFQGGEDDEPMAPQTIQFGSFIFDMKKNNMKEGVLSNTATWGTNLIFKGSNLLKQKMKLKRIIIIGTMHVEVEWSPT